MLERLDWCLGLLGLVAAVNDRLVVFLAREVVFLALGADLAEVALVISFSVRVADCGAAAVWTTRADLARATEVVRPPVCQLEPWNVRGEGFVEAAVVEDNVFGRLVDAELDRSSTSARLCFVSLYWMCSWRRL